MNKKILFPIILLIVVFSLVMARQNFVLADNSHSIDLESGYSQYLSNTSGTKGSDYTALTVEAWIKPESLPSSNNHHIIAAEASADSKFLLSLFNDNGTHKVKFGGEWTTTGWSHFSVAYNTPTDSWTHVAATWSGDGGVIKIYVNGVLKGTSGTIDGSFINETYGVFIGRHASAAIEYFDGKIDDVRIWDSVRTETEIDDYKAVELSGSESGLKQYWKLDNALTSSVSGGLTMTNNGSAVFSSEAAYPIEDLKAHKPADESVTSSTILQNDNDLKLSFIAGKKYAIEGMIVASSTSATPDIKLAFDIPAGGAVVDMGLLSASETNFRRGQWLGGAGTVSAEIPIVAGSPTVIQVSGVIQMGSTSGDMILKWAQESSNSSATTVMRGSYLLATEI